MRRLLLLCLLSLLIACTADPALDLVQLEAQARGGDAQAIARLVGLLKAREAGLSDRVYATLVELGEPAVPALLEQAGSGDTQQREYAVAALGTLRATVALPAIRGVLADASLQRRYVAAWALGEIGDPQAIPALVTALADQDTVVRRYATRALIKFNKAAVPPLVDYLQSAEGEGAAGAIRALGDIVDPRALEVLLAHAQGPLRAEAFLALGKLRDPQAETVLMAGLADTDWRARMNAAMALGPLGSPVAAAALEKRLEDEVHVVREWAARSLEMITGQPVLYRNSKDEYVRPYSVYH